MAANLCEAWRRITEGTIQEAWDIFEGEDWEDIINHEEQIENEDLQSALSFYESLIVIPEE